MDVRNNERRKGSTDTWVTFNQSEMSLPREGRGGKFLVIASSGSGGEEGVNREDPCENMYVSRPASEMILKVRRKFYIAVDRKRQNKNLFCCS